jgi:hypothetical protein
MNDNRRLAAPLGLGAILLVVLAALFGLRPGERNQPGAKAVEAKAEPVELASPPAGAEPHRSFVVDRLHPSVVPGDAKRLHFGETTCLIVTVPDPVYTPFGFWFDQVVDSLTRAAGEIGYAPAGHWFGWETELKSPGKGDANRKAGQADRKPGDVEEPTYATYPGVLLFRSMKAATQCYLVVLLVGETVNGVHGVALQKALDLAGEIDLGCNRPESRIRLVAPFFTGAQAGLFRTLKEWAGLPQGEKFSFSVISGSANGLDPSLPVNLFGPQAKRCTLHSTIVPSHIQLEKVLEFLNSHGEARAASENGGAHDVGLLVESNTGFGLEQVLNESERLHGIIYLPYPAHLARVRAAYERARAEREHRLNLGTVDLSVEGRRRYHVNPDTVATLDETTTPRLADRAVDDITAAIRRHRVKYVGLMATDPQDVVFFVERIKRDCPDVQIFVTGMDLYYALLENRPSMRGVVVSSTYPLFPPNQGWANPGDPVQETFQSECAQGCYNAALCHLAEMVKPLPGGKTPDQFKRERLREYHQPMFAGVESSKPPVWILVIGENGRYVPEEFFDYKDADRLMVTVSAGSPSPVAWPGLGTAVVPFASVLFAAGATLIWVLCGRTAPGKVLAICGMLQGQTGWRRLAGWWRAPLTEMEQQAGLCLSAALTVVLIILAPLLFSVHVLLGRWFFKDPRWTWVCLVFVAALAWSMLAVALLLQVRLLLRHALRPATGRTLPRVGWLAVKGVVFAGGLAFAGHLLAQFMTETPAHLVLFVERAVNAVTGYSVLMPLVLLALGFLLMAYCTVRQHVLGERYRIECPYPETMPDHLPNTTIAALSRHLHQSSGELREELTSFGVFCRRRWRWLLAGGIAYSLAALVLWSRYRSTFETRAWDAVFLTGFTFLAAGVLAGVLRVLTGWKRLEDLLKEMAVVPMVHAFERLPRTAAALFGGYFLSRRPRAFHLLIPLHLLRQLPREVVPHSEALTAAPSKDAPEPAAAVSVPRNGLPADLALCPIGKVVGPGLAPVISREDYPGRQWSALSPVAQTLIGTLAAYWPDYTIPEAYGEQVPEVNGEKTAAPSRKEGVPTWLEPAEDFVALHTTVFVSQFFIVLRLLAWGVVWPSVMLLLAASVYPFQPEQLILSLQLGLLFAVVASLVWVLVRIVKNEIVSRIMKSTPNKLELRWTFVATTLQYVGPIALIVIAQLSGGMRAIVEPLLNMVR